MTAPLKDSCEIHALAFTQKVTLCNLPRIWPALEWKVGPMLR